MFPYYHTSNTTNRNQGSFSLRNKRMEVFGEGRIPIIANVGEVQLGVETRGKELVHVQRENSDMITNVIQQLTGLGIDEQSIQTSDYSIYPIYDFVNGHQEFAGYTVNHMLTVTVTNIEKLGLVVDTAVKSGANRISNISFSYSNPKEIYNKALIQAVQDAIGKARAISQYLHIPLDNIPYFIEEQFEQREMRPFETFQGVQSASTPIFPEKQQIKARVRLIFLYQ